MPAATSASRTVQLWSQGSHALARTDVTIELTTGRMTGTTFELTDSDVATVAVDDTLRPDELRRLRDALAATCVVPEAAGGGPVGAPGGSSHVVVDERLRILPGAPMQPGPEGQRIAPVDRATWTALMDAFPPMRPTERP